VGDAEIALYPDSSGFLRLELRGGGHGVDVTGTCRRG